MWCNGGARSRRLSANRVADAQGAHLLSEFDRHAPRLHRTRLSGPELLPRPETFDSRCWSCRPASIRQSRVSFSGRPNRIGWRAPPASGVFAHGRERQGLRCLGSPLSGRLARHLHPPRSLDAAVGRPGAQLPPDALGGSNRAAWSAMAHEPRTTAKVDLRSAAGSPSGIVTAAPTPWTLRPTQSSPCCWRTWPNTYCFRCLAAKLQVSEKDIRDSVQLQVLASQLHIWRRRCAECGHEDDLLQLAK